MEPNEMIAEIHRLTQELNNLKAVATKWLGEIDLATRMAADELAGRAPLDDD